MPIFEYRGLNKSGKNIKGTIDAENIRMAKSRLKKQGVYVANIKGKYKKSDSKNGLSSLKRGRVNVEDLALMTRQLATLLKANIPLVESLSAVSDQVDNPILSETMAEIKNSVNEGGAFYKALSRYPKIFSKIYVSMCEAGELSGTLGLILLRLAEFTESQNELRSKVGSALLYPLLMFAATLLMLIFIFIFIIPKMVAVFEASPDLILPWYTEAVISFSGFLVSYWYIVGIGIFVFLFLFRNWKDSDAGRPKWDAFILKVPKAGPLIRLVAVSHFARTLSTLLDGGVSVVDAMDIVKNVVNNSVLAAAIKEARDNITEGESIAGPLRRSGEFPPMVIHMISIGEKTGELENMLSQVSDSYDFQVKNKLEGFTSILGPAMLLVMGGVVGSIVFSIMIPMFDMMNFAG